MDNQKLTQRIYEGVFPVKVIHENDDYGHLHFNSYLSYVDLATDRFLREVGFSHRNFALENGVFLIHHSGKNKHHKEVKKFEDLDIRLQVNMKKNLILEIRYDFLSKGDVVFCYDSSWVFIDSVTKKHVKVPKFFTEALEEVNKKKRD